MRAAPPREWKPLEEAVPRDVFQAEVEAWAKRIGVQPKVVQVRPMKRKWGSCSTNGRLSFSTDLLTAPTKIRKRVIVEELLHLKVPNHGKLFKALRPFCGAGSFPSDNSPLPNGIIAVFIIPKRPNGGFAV